MVSYDWFEWFRNDNKNEGKFKENWSVEIPPFDCNLVTLVVWPRYQWDLFQSYSNTERKRIIRPSKINEHKINANKENKFKSLFTIEWSRRLLAKFQYRADQLSVYHLLLVVRLGFLYSVMMMSRMPSYPLDWIFVFTIQMTDKKTNKPLGISNSISIDKSKLCQFSARNFTFSVSSSLIIIIIYSM